VQAKEGDADQASGILNWAWNWLFVQMAPALHPCRLQLGAAPGPAVAAALAAVGNRSVADMRVGVSEGSMGHAIGVATFSRVWIRYVQVVALM
jgi:hypothetical protein